jgi:hypothetical protein
MNKRSLRTHSRNFLFFIFHRNLDAVATRQFIGLAYDYFNEEKLILGFTLLVIDIEEK